MLTRSRGMGASAVLGLAVLASYGALAAVALSAVGGGSVLSFPGWAVDAIIQVNAAPAPPHLAIRERDGNADPAVDRPARPSSSRRPHPRPAPPSPSPRATTVARERRRAGSGNGGGSGRRVAAPARLWSTRFQRRPARAAAQPPARHRTCERQPGGSTTAASIPICPRGAITITTGWTLTTITRGITRRGTGTRSGRITITTRGITRRRHEALARRSHQHHHAWHHPPRHGHSPPSHQHHHAWHHPPRHGHRCHGGSSQDARIAPSRRAPPRWSHGNGSS